MIDIRYNGQAFEMDPNSETLGISVAGAILNDPENLLGSHSLSVKLPLTDRNKRLINFGHILENRSARNELQVTLYILGTPWKTCSFRFGVGSDSINGYLKIDLGEIASKMKDTPLWHVGYNNYGDYIADNNFKRITVGTNWQTVEDTLNDCAANPNKYPFAFIPTKNMGFWGEHEGQTLKEYSAHFGGYINPWGTTGRTGKPPGYISHTRGYSTLIYLMCPYLKLTYVIQELCTFLGFRAMGSFLTDPIAQKLLIYNNVAFPAFFDKGLFFEPKNHLPEISIGDFLKAVRNKFSLAIYFNTTDRTATFDTAKTILEDSEILDLTPFVDPVFQVETPTVGAVEIIDEVDDDDKMYKTHSYKTSIVFGQASEEKPQEVSTKFGTLFMAIEENPDYRETLWRVPVVNQVGKISDKKARGSSAYKAATDRSEDFKLRLLINHGLAESSIEGVLYPYASNDDNSYSGSYIYDVSLIPTAAKSVTQLYNKPWYDFFLKSERLPLNMTLPVHLFFQVNPLKRIALRLQNSVLLHYLIGKMDFQLPAVGGYISTRMDLYPIIPDLSLNSADVGFTRDTLNNNGHVYVKLTRVINGMETYTNPDNGATEFWSYDDHLLEFFADPAGLIPKNVFDLQIIFLVTDTIYPPGSTYQGEKVYTANGGSLTIEKQLVSYHYDYRDPIDDRNDLSTNTSTNYALKDTGNYTAI